MTVASLALVLTPHGHLLFAPAPDAPALPEAVRQRLTDAFAQGSGHGLLQLGAGEVETVLPAALVFWREFATRYITSLCTSSEPAEGGDARIASIAAPSTEDLAVLATAAPPMTGAEYLLNGADVTVKDTKRYADTGGWGYYNFNHYEPKAPTAKLRPQSECAYCHMASAKKDDVWTQYYPLLDN